MSCLAGPPVASGEMGKQLLPVGVRLCDTGRGGAVAPFISIHDRLL